MKESLKVTEIIPYGKKKSRVLTDGDLVFSLYRTEIRTYGIQEDAEISAELWEEKLFPLLSRRARERTVRLLEVRDYAETELLRKLLEGYCPRECAEAAVAWAKERHFLDDWRFAERYVAWHGEGKSRRRLLAELKEKGILEETAASVLEENTPDEALQIQRLLSKYHYEPEMDWKEKQRIAARLARKGYSWQQISGCMGEWDPA